MTLSCTRILKFWMSPNESWKCNDFCAKRSLLSEALKLNCLFVVVCCLFVVNNFREFHACPEACVTFSKPRAGEGGTFVDTILENPKKVVENSVFARCCQFSGTRFWTTFERFFWTFFSKLQIFWRFAPPARGLLSSILSSSGTVLWEIFRSILKLTGKPRNITVDQNDVSKHRWR